MSTALGKQKESNMTPKDPEAQAAIASGLRDSYIPGWRERRRRESIAANYDPKLEEMERQLREDPDKFDRIYGPHGRVLVGLNQKARLAADDEPKGAA